MISVSFRPKHVTGRRENTYFRSRSFILVTACWPVTKKLLRIFTWTRIIIWLDENVGGIFVVNNSCERDCRFPEASCGSMDRPMWIQISILRVALRWNRLYFDLSRLVRYAVSFWCNLKILIRLYDKEYVFKIKIFLFYIIVGYSNAISLSNGLILFRKKYVGGLKAKGFLFDFLSFFC